MKRPVFLICLLFSLFLPAVPVQAADDVIEKTFCTQGIAYESVDALKLDLLNNAKKAVIDELFGEFIVASTAVENFVVTKDQIQTSSLGFVRVEGNTNFHNGKDFADVCVTIRAYVTTEDRAKFDPEKLEKKYCDADDNLTTAQLIAYVKDEVVIQALIEYNPKLKGASKDSLLPLVQKVTYLESGFISDTQTYCAEFEGYVVPVEVMAFLGTDVSVINSEPVQGEKISQWASKIYSFSSQYNNDGWSAKQVLGEPNITRCGDVAGSWTTSASGTQFIEVGFEKVVYPEKLIIRQNNQVGFVTRLEFFSSDGSSEAVEVTDTLTDCPGESEFEVGNIINFPTNRVKVYINASHGGYEEVDAIALQGFELTQEALASRNEPSVSVDADAIDMTGLWTWELNANRQIDSNGSISAINSTGTTLATFESNGKNLTGKFMGVEGNLCAQADIKGEIDGNQVSWLVQYTGSCCLNAEMTYSGTINQDTMTIIGTFEPVGRPPSSSCSLWWGTFLQAKKNDRIL